VRTLGSKTTYKEYYQVRGEGEGNGGATREEAIATAASGCKSDKEDCSSRRDADFDRRAEGEG
jgi:hypothetical protein